MPDIRKPSQETLREYLERRRGREHEPPPAPEVIRRELGWELVPDNAKPAPPERD